MTITVEQELQEYISQLSEPEKQSILQLIKTFVQGREKAERISVEEYNRELKEAEGEYEKGEFISHEEMVKQMKQW